MSHQVAETILSQLGGRRFLAMTGAKNLLGSSDALSFRINGRFDGRMVSGVRIVLDPSDTYTVETFIIRKLERKVIETVRDIYCDQLQEVFTRLTGLHTHL